MTSTSGRARGFTLVEVLVALVVFATLALGVMALTGTSLGDIGRLKQSADSEGIWGPILQASLQELAKASPRPKVDSPWSWDSPWGQVRVRFVVMNEIAQDDFGVVRLIWEDPARKRPPIETVTWFSRATREIVP